MDRRSFLAVSLLSVAGCGQLPASDTPTSAPATGTATETTEPTATRTVTPTDSPTASPTPSSTETPTEPPTETPTETPGLSPLEQRVASALDGAIRALTSAVDTYAGSEGGSLLDVSAATRSFPRIAVLEDLSEADEFIGTARKRASSRQRARVAAVEDARQFIWLCLDTQQPVIAAYGEVQRGRAGVDEERESDIDAAVRDLRDEHSRADRNLARIRDETSAETVSVVPAIPVAEYDAKVGQFDAEIGGFGSLAEFLDRLRTATADLNDAERFDRVESERNAREAAREAAAAFESLATELRSFVADLPEGGAALDGISTDLADLAETKAAKARRIESNNQ